MSTYNEMFKLTPKVADLIEGAVRQPIGHLARLKASIQHNNAEVVKNYWVNASIGNPIKNPVRSETSYG